MIPRGSASGMSALCFVLVALAGSAAAQSFNDTNFKPTFQQCVRDASSLDDCATMPYWDVSRVTYMASLCEKHVVDCTDFNVDISRWDVSSVTDMSDMLRRATSFDQDISRWQVSHRRPRRHRRHPAARGWRRSATVCFATA